MLSNVSFVLSMSFVAGNGFRCVCKGTKKNGKGRNAKVEKVIVKGCGARAIRLVSGRRLLARCRSRS